MNYLVTGAAGFIGAAIVQKLLAEGNECITIDNFSTGKKENVPAGCRLIQGDVADAKIIEKLENEKIDAVIHIAGQSSGEVSFANPIYDLHTNTQSTVLLLKLAEKIGCKKFIYASSMSVYGEHENPCCDERDLAAPKSFYAVGKLASENYMRIFSQDGMACTALRFFNVYGEGQNLENLKQGMASIYLAMAIKDHCIEVKGCKERFRDFVYISDIVEAVERSLIFTEGYRVFNVCTGVPTTVEQVIDKIKSKLPYSVDVKYMKGTPGDQFGIYGDNSSIYEELNWLPKVSFDEGMERMILWARETLGDID